VPAAAAAACLCLLTAPARAVTPGVARPRPQPLASEWWFSAWDIQSRVWPLTMGAGATVALLVIARRRRRRQAGTRDGSSAPGPGGA
jgi:hypothetical protein